MEECSEVCQTVNMNMATAISGIINLSAFKSQYNASIIRDFQWPQIHQLVLCRP